ncbi:MAG TPA: hypothetical protein VK961_28865 [Chthoniobacter sp.]|nr:hypothetical protein [Chthoniobacter sp.]
MKFIRPALLPPGKSLRPILTRFALGMAVAMTAVACSAPERHHESGVPPAYSQSTYQRPAGALNTPNNTGNPPEDLDPHTPHWGDVRRNY